MRGRHGLLDQLRQGLWLNNISLVNPAFPSQIYSSNRLGSSPEVHNRTEVIVKTYGLRFERQSESMNDSIRLTHFLHSGHKDLPVDGVLYPHSGGHYNSVSKSKARNRISKARRSWSGFLALRHDAFWFRNKIVRFAAISWRKVCHATLHHDSPTNRGVAIGVPVIFILVW